MTMYASNVRVVNGQLLMENRTAQLFNNVDVDAIKMVF